MSDIFLMAIDGLDRVIKESDHTTEKYFRMTEAEMRFLKIAKMILEDKYIRENKRV